MKTNIRVFVSLLVLAAMLVSMPISALAMDDNPEDSVLDSVGKDDVMDVYELADNLVGFLNENYPENIRTRFKFSDEEEINLEAIARKRGMLISGGEPDIERAAAAVLDEFRSGKLGKISLERPE